MEKWNDLFAAVGAYDATVTATEKEAAIVNPANGNVIHVIDESAPGGEGPVGALQGIYRRIRHPAPPL